MSGKDDTPTPASRKVSLVLAAILLTMVAWVPAWAQNSVPPSARQAATMPEYASRLAGHARPQTASRSSTAARRSGRQLPLDDQVIYANGPINGTTDAWSINFGFVVSDTFTVPGAGTSVTGLSFGAWLFAGDTLQSAEVSITSGPNSGTSYFNQTINFTQSGCVGNQYGYNVCTEAGTFTASSLASGTYWVNLQNAVVNSGSSVYWDENSGVGCQSQGCPSQADENTVGTIPSEAFTILGYASTQPPPPQCFESAGNLQIIHDFTIQEGGGQVGPGVTIDRAGNLYGVTATGGNNSAGLAFKQYRAGDGWIFNPLYSFTGGYSGGNPTGVLVGPNGSLYGGAAGGNQNCVDGSQYCGLAFNLTPTPSACLTALCSWMERVPYRFNGGDDSFEGINVTAFDQEGNLYGTSTDGGGGGCNGFGCGTVFKLTPTGAGWTESILYSFTGGNDGSAPGQVLVGNDGNLYGVANGGANGDGVVFQLTPSGNGWTQSVLHTFQGRSDGTNPSYLVQDGAGNLYGIAFIPYFNTSPPIFMLQKSGQGWVFNEYFVDHPYGDYEFLNNLAIDAAGNLYGTGEGGEGCSGERCNGSKNTSYTSYAYIFTASYGSNGWQYQDLRFFGDVEFPASGALALDPQGNLYGTTWSCGAYGAGTIWQLSP